MDWVTEFYLIVQSFLNVVPYESNTYFGFYNNINAYISVGKDSLSSSKDIHAKFHNEIDAYTSAIKPNV